MNIIRNGKVVVIALLLLSANAEAQTTGQARKNLITGFGASCFQVQRALPSNAAADSARLHNYCDCAATYLADVMNNEYVAAFERGAVKLSIDTMRMAGAYCRTHNNY